MQTNDVVFTYPITACACSLSGNVIEVLDVAVEISSPMVPLLVARNGIQRQQFDDDDGTTMPMALFS